MDSINFSKQIPSEIEIRRERVFLLLAGIFLGSMAMLNIIGITKILQLGPLTVAVGVLPYPLTFLCTDLLGEFYGKRRANMVVWTGLILNLFVIGIVWLGDLLPATTAGPPWQTLQLASPAGLPNGSVVETSAELFHLIYACTAGAVFASMVAYLAAQFCDVHLFHFFKNLTKGKHLWLRNNGSTLVSQLVDSFMVVTITFGAAYLDNQVTLTAMLSLFFGNYAFKFGAALLDTIPFYGISRYLREYLQVDPITGRNLGGEH